MALEYSGKSFRTTVFEYSGKSFRTTVWRTDAPSWASLHAQAFRALGGVPRYAVLDDPREGVIEPDLYAPEWNPVYAALLAHYGSVAGPCRVGDPERSSRARPPCSSTSTRARTCF